MVVRDYRFDIGIILFESGEGKFKCIFWFFDFEEVFF